MPVGFIDLLRAFIVVEFVLIRRDPTLARLQHFRIFRLLDFFLANRNIAAYVRDQCCHPKADGVLLARDRRLTKPREQYLYLAQIN